MRRVRPFLLPAGILALILALAIWLGGRHPGQDPVRDHSSLRSNPWGVKALAELCRQSGLPARAWSRPLTMLSARQRLLCLFDPSRPVPGWEVDALLDWVKAGGTVVVAVDMNNDHNLLWGSNRNPDQELLAQLGLLAEAQAPETSLATAVPGSPELAEVGAVRVPGPYRVRPATAADLARLTKETARTDKGKPRSKQQPDFRPRVQLVWAPLLRDANGLVAAKATHGRGRVYVISEAEVFANENLARNDNVVFAANLLFGARAGVVHFDEHIHMVRVGLSDEALELDPARAYWALRLALLAVALFFIGQMLRFGAPVPLKVRPRRSALEFVEALADLYRRAEARGAVLGILRHTFRQRLAAAVGLSPETPGPALAAAVARQRGVPEAQLAGLLAHLDDPALAAHLTEHDLLRLARQISTLEEAATHGR